MKKIAYFSNTDFSLYNFRKELMVRMRSKNFHVFAIGSETKKEIAKEIEKQEIEFISISLKRGLNFLGGDILYFLRVFFLSKNHKFNICHNFTIKPCIYGTLAQKLAGINSIYCTITGLGYSFEKNGLLNKTVICLYRFSLKYADKIVFQNSDDRDLFIKMKIVNPEKTFLIKGSGVDLDYFSGEKSFFNRDLPFPEAAKNKQIVITLVARMLYSKGIGEFVESAKRLKNKHDNLKFLLVGPIDKENPSGISEKKIKEWQEEKIIKYLGEQKDVKAVLSITDIFVFPSYGEGIPRALLEAGAMEKALVATNVAGCRDIIDDGVNGFFVEPKNTADLTEKIEKLIIMSEEKRRELGRASRKKIKREFDEKIIIKKYLEEIYKIN
jgi:glycosyltransferase involved in cell wall biosynthesis